MGSSPRPSLGADLQASASRPRRASLPARLSPLPRVSPSGVVSLDANEVLHMSSNLGLDNTFHAKAWPELSQSKLRKASHAQSSDDLPPITVSRGNGTSWSVH